jgi:TRAP-type C4-dicarboxylate transport system substrate-binding protein
MKKKVVSMLLCASMVAVFAVGCGSSSSDSTTDTDAGTEAETGTSDAAEADTADDADTADAAAEDDGTVYTLNVQSHDPETSATGQFLNDWAASIEEASNGRLEINVYHGGTLGGPKDTVDMIRNGTCDIGWGLQSFFADTFPVTEVFQLPCIDIERATQGSEAIWNFYNETDYMDAEYSEFHVLLLHTNCQSPISTVSKKIESVEDLKGLQLRGNAGPPTTFIQNLGANPVSVSINDLYSNLDKGTIDGCLTDWHAINSFKLDETLSYYLDENIGVSTYFLMMNQSVYDSLPSDLQQILDEKSAEAIQYTTAWDDVEDTIKADESVSSKIYNLSDEERAKLEEVADETAQQWIESMNEKGYDGQAIYDKAMECIEAAK